MIYGDFPYVLMHYFHDNLNAGHMIIEIHDNVRIEDIQDKFHAFYPFLKIEFFSGPHHWYEASAESRKINPDSTLESIRKKHSHGPFEIHSRFRTGDVEQLFRERYGLHCQIYRLSHNNWIQTVGTDSLTLQEQDELGRKSCLEDSNGMSESITANENPL